MSGSAFSLLTAGGAKFDKRRFGGDMTLFSDKAGSSSKSGKSDNEPSKKRKRPSHKPSTGSSAPNFFASTGEATAINTNDEPVDEAESSSSSRPASPEPSAAPYSHLSIKLTSLPPLASSSASGTLGRGNSAPLPRSIRPALSSLTLHPFRPLTSAQGLPLLRALEEAGVRSLWGVQCAAAGVILEGRDLLLSAPTGSGKTLGWLGPLLVRMGDPAKEVKGRQGSMGIRTVVLVPTSALAQQIGDVVALVAKGRSWRCVVLDGEPRRKSNNGGQSAAGKTKKSKGRKTLEREVCACSPGGGMPIRRPEGKRAKKGKGKGKIRGEEEVEEQEESETEDEGDTEEDEQEDEGEERGDQGSDGGDAVAPQVGKRVASRPKPVGAGIDILISTPKRLAHLVGSGRLSLAQTRHIILDEADLLHTPTFLPSTDLILHACVGQSPSATATAHSKTSAGETSPNQGDTDGHGLLKVFSSATMPSMVERWAVGWCARSTSGLDGVRVVVGNKDAPLPSIPQTLLYTSSPSGSYLALLSLLSSGGLPWPSLIFCNTLQTALALYKRLRVEDSPFPSSGSGAGASGPSLLGARVGLVHGKQSESERGETLRRFKEGDVWVLIGTDVLGRGLDLGVGGVRSVVNYECPSTPATYIHRLGRLRLAPSDTTDTPRSRTTEIKQGRGEIRATTFFTNTDLPRLRSVANVILQSGGEVPEWVKGVRKGQKAPKRLEAVGRKGMARGKGGKRRRVDGTEREKRGHNQGLSRTNGDEEGEEGGNGGGWTVVGPDEEED